MKGRFPLARSMTADRRGVSAIEFALVFPVIVIMMLAGIQLVLYIRAIQRIELVANSISEMLSQAAPPASSTTASVSQTDLHFAFDSTMVLFPYVLKDAARQNIAWPQDITIDFASIQFQSNGLSCGTNADQSACYIATVGWTTTGTSGANYRPCGASQTPANNLATPTRSTLPRSLYGAGSVIAVDIAFTFVPTFGASFLSAIPIRRSVFVQPRYATYITFNTTNNDGIATLCPGFS